MKQLRHKIAQEFNLSTKEFKLSNDKYIYNELSETLLRDAGFKDYFIEKVENFYTINHPKNLLIKNQKFFDRLFELLALDSAYNDYWSLLMKLPQNEILKNKIKNLNLGEHKSEAW